jgi:hypothetical protein
MVVKVRNLLLLEQDSLLLKSKNYHIQTYL